MVSVSDALEAARAFALAGTATGAVRHDGGRIHDSFVVTCAAGPGCRRYLAQRINEHVFPGVAVLMQNVERVLSHLEAQRGRDASAGDVRLKLARSRSGATWWQDADGRSWRIYEFIEGARVHERVTDPGQAAEAGRAFGRFQRALSTLPSAALTPTLPDFHHTPKRLDALRQAWRRDAAKRAAEVGRELAWVERLAWLAPMIQEGLDHGRLPHRIVHNDAKIANVLFDEGTQTALCVTDLDTVMPGSPLHDVGDMMRTMTSAHGEDDPDAARVGIHRDWVEALLSGYLIEARLFLTRDEMEGIATCGAVIGFEQVVRFLTDHLEGDVYYAVEFPGQNLRRARVQMAMVEGLLERRANIHDITCGFGRPS